MARIEIELGRRGEQDAVDYLKGKGYIIIDTNYRTRLGQIDIIARDNNTICFVEVKTQESGRFGSPDEKVVISKQRKISSVALVFLKQNKLLNSPARFDVVSISYPRGYRERPSDIPSGHRRFIRAVDTYAQAKIKLIKNAFELDSRYLY